MADRIDDGLPGGVAGQKIGANGASPWNCDVPAYSSEKLFGRKKRVHIEHAGNIYVLQITRQDKLILTK